jgi:hypothetical protein
MENKLTPEQVQEENEYTEGFRTFEEGYKECYHRKFPANKPSPEWYKGYYYANNEIASEYGKGWNNFFHEYPHREISSIAWLNGYKDAEEFNSGNKLKTIYNGLEQ